MLNLVVAVALIWLATWFAINRLVDLSRSIKD